MNNLRELIEMASEHVESVFDPQKTMMMRHLCIAADGGLSVFVSPVASIEDEVLFREVLPAAFRVRFVRWVFVSEAWTAEMKRGDQLPAQHPRRIEIVAFYGTEAATGETLTASRQIYRPAIGGARLLPLVYETRQAKFVMGAQP